MTRKWGNDWQKIYKKNQVMEMSTEWFISAVETHVNLRNKSGVFWVCTEVTTWEGMHRKVSKSLKYFTVPAVWSPCIRVALVKLIPCDWCVWFTLLNMVILTQGLGKFYDIWCHSGQTNTHIRLDWSITALSIQFRLYHAFKVELYYKYYNLISINSWGKITEKENITITVDLV